MEDNNLNPTGVPEENAAEAAAETAAETAETVQESADTLADKVADKVEAFGETAENVSDKVVDTVTGVVDAAGEAADEFGEKVADVVTGADNAAEAAAETVTDTAAETADAAKTESSSFVDKVADVVNAAGEAADSFGEKVADKVSETFGGADNAANTASADANSTQQAIQPNVIYTAAGAPMKDKKDNTLGLISLILGIVSCIFNIANIPMLFLGVGVCCAPIGGLLALAAIIIGIVSLVTKKQSGKAMALIGIISAALPAILLIIFIILMAVGVLAPAAAQSLSY